MALMSFAHLKKEMPNKTDGGNTSRAAFLHDTLISNLHDFPKAAAAIDENASRNDLQASGDVFRTCYAVPYIMPTASIIRVNLCRGCPRFIPELEAAENNLKKSKAGYGFCLRESDSGGEEYIAIPAKSTVDRCYINLTWDK